MEHVYAVIGAGAQGVAAGYDLATYGNASLVIMVDTYGERAKAGARRINQLCGRHIAKPYTANATDPRLERTLMGVSAIVSAAHYELNPLLLAMAVRNRSHFVDLGGNTTITLAEQRFSEAAKRSGVTGVPDCGMGPGLNLSIANYAMQMVGKPKKVRILCGGLPQFPTGMLRYDLLFSMSGLVNEYSGFAVELRDGKIVSVPTLRDRAWVKINGIGHLESAVTSGGLSTAAQTWKGTLSDLSYQTLRYPDHWDLVQSFAMEGVLEERLTELLGTTITNPPDIGIIRVECTDENDVDRVALELVDKFDPVTGFTAMQRLTGFHASIIAILATEGKLEQGVLPVESIDGKLVLSELSKRGIVVNEV